MPVQGSTLAFLKSAFYKTCFCIGLGTASYYSVAEVRSWFGADHSVSAPSEIQLKVATLTAAPTAAETLGLPSQPMSAAQVNDARALAQNQNLKPALTTLASADKPAAPPIAAAATEATATGSPSPSPSPGEATAAKDGEKKDDAKKDSEKKDGEPQTETAGVMAPPANVGPVNALGQPYPANFQGNLGSGSVPNTDTNTAGNTAGGVVVPQTTASNGFSGSSGGSGSEGSGATSSGLPTTPGSALNSGSSSGSSGSTYTGGGTTTSTSSSTASTSSSSNLTVADIAALTSPIKAFFSDQTENVSGLVCSVGAQTNTVVDCIRNNHYAIHTDRWNTTYGLAPDASFAVSSTSSASHLQVNLNLKFQDSQLNFQTTSLYVYPSETLIHTESKSGKLYKVYELKLPDVTVMGGEKITSLVATLVYEVSASGAAGAMTTDSALTFNRSHVQTTNTIWDTTTTNRMPAANDQVIVTDTINYTMNLEKSP